MRQRRAARFLFTAGILFASALASPFVLAQGAGAKPAPVAQKAPKPGQKPANKATKPGAGKPGSKPQAGKPASKPGKPTAKQAPQTRKAGEPGEPDENARRAIAGTPASPYRTIEESPELRAMRELDLALFSVAPSSGDPWPSNDLPKLDRGDPVLFATGVPPQAELPRLVQPASSEDLSWLRKLDLPDIPVRWDARVIRYLEFYKNNSRGRSMVASWMKKSGRYGAAIRRVLREQGMPEDIVWLALVESGFDPTIHSPAGAAGLWQFMPEGARIYGLTVDRWIDERLDPERSTLAAARYLSDLKKRFGSFELAFAAYNMGYGGLLSAIRKYNTNDFWELSRLEAGLPLETALYVPKIISMAIVAKNCAVFGCDNIELDPAITFDKVSVGAGVSLKTIATAAGVDENAVEALNPQLPASRSPPLDPGERPGSKASEKALSYVVRVPPGTGPRAAKSVSKLAEGEEKLERHKVRWGESVEDIATLWHTTKSSLLALNGLQKGEQVRPGTILLVPKAAGEKPTTASLFTDTPGQKPVIVVPAESFARPDKRRVFYRVAAGDTPHGIAGGLDVPQAELCRWNAIDCTAALHEGMTLQVFVPKERTIQDALVLEEEGARVLPVGSQEFFTHFESLKGRKRIEVVAAEGETWRGLSKRYGLTLGMLERINHRSRTSALSAGEKVVVYVPLNNTPKAAPPPEKDAPEEKGEAQVAAAHPVDDHPAPAEDIDPKAETAPAAADEPAATKPAVLSVEPAPKDTKAPKSPKSPNETNEAAAKEPLDVKAPKDAKEPKGGALPPVDPKAPTPQQKPASPRR